MKQKYTLTVANSQINIATEQPKDEIDAIVGVVDRRIREIHLHSKTCSRTDAAIILCLEYCAEKMELQKTIRSFNSQVERLNLMSEAANKEMAALQRENEMLRATLALGAKSSSRKTEVEQIAFDDLETEEMVEEAKHPGYDVIFVDEEESAPASDESKREKPHAKARKKKVRAMFDMISFDDI
jgi:cell division protein ZapA (FtsZ GTPase activity inhibitor)